MRTCAFSSGDSTDATIVVSGVTLAGFVRSVGRSEISAKSGSAFPVLVSVPPIEITLAATPSEVTNCATLKKPFESVTPAGSSASCSPLPFKSTKTEAPEIGASTTRPSNASVTLTDNDCDALSAPSDTSTVSSYSLSESESPADSKSGACENDSSPADEMENRPPSAPVATE